MSEAKNPATMSPTRACEIVGHALPRERWREPTNDEAAAGLQVLGKLVGKAEAASPTWVRRLAVTADGKAWLLMVNGSMVNQWPLPPFGWPAALPMGEAVELLQSDRNPELELERQLAQARKQQDEAAERTRRTRARQQAEAEARARLEQERRDFRAAEWTLLVGWQRFACRLALAVEGAIPELARAIRAAVAAELVPDKADSFPRGVWFEGLGVEGLDEGQREAAGRLAQGERDAWTVATVPADKLTALEFLRGPNPREIAAHVRDARRQDPAVYSYSKAAGRR